MCALLLPAAGAGAQQPGGGYTVGGVQLSGGGARSPPPPPQSVVHGSMRGGGFFPGFYYERENVPVIEREIIREVPADPAPPPPPRKPYVVGRSYDSLPDGCMKMIDRGAIFFQCSGEWYRQTAAGQYKAVSAPL